MSQRRKIAIAYAFAVPVVFLIVLFQHASLVGVTGTVGEIAQAAQVMEELRSAGSLLKEARANAQKYVASGGDGSYSTAYQKSVAAFRDTLAKIGEQIREEEPVRAKLQSIAPLVSKQLGLFDQAMAAVKKNPADRAKAASSLETQDMLGEIDNIMEQINALQQIRMREQVPASNHSLRLAKMITTYGGGLLIWLVGVAAFLLFYDEKARAWTGVERRVHTKILQALPLGVSVATEAGIILYANPAEEALMGYKPGGLLGNSAKILHDLDGPAGERTVNDILDRLLAGESWEGELPLRKADGTIQKLPSWVLNLDVPGKVYRVFVHRGS